MGNCHYCHRALENEEAKQIGYGTDCITQISKQVVHQERMTMVDGKSVTIWEVDRTKTPSDILKHWDCIQRKKTKLNGNAPSFGKTLFEGVKTLFSKWGSKLKKHQPNPVAGEGRGPSAHIHAQPEKTGISSALKGPVNPRKMQETIQQAKTETIKKKPRRTLDDLMQELMQQGELKVTKGKFGNQYVKVKTDVVNRLRKMNIQHKIRIIKDKRKMTMVGFAIVVALTSSMTFSKLTDPVQANVLDTKFQDIGESHWMRQNGTLKWWEDRGIQGYGNGQFKPENQVSEAEFYTMIAKAYGENVSCQAQCTPWYKGAYEMVQQYSMPEYGNPNGKLTRTKVAEIIASAQGYSYKGNDAVKFLLVNHLSNGRTKPTVAGYQGSATMTRAESFQFLRNVLMNGASPQLEGAGAHPTDSSKLQQDYEQFLKEKGLDSAKESYVDDLQNGVGHTGKTYDPHSKSIDTTKMKPGDTVSLD